MAINAALLKNHKFPDVEQSYSEREALLYALSVGYGATAELGRELPFVYEKDMQTVPTMAAVLAYPGLWIKTPEFGIDWMNVVHGEQSIRFHADLPSSGTVVGKMSVDSVTDKGPGKGALLLQRRDVFDQSTGTLLATLEQLNVCRGDGGYSAGGGADGNQKSDPVPAPLAALPEEPPHRVVRTTTSERMAMFYRLCADRHPIHVDPSAAQAAGFKGPILHGLASYAIIGRLILRTYCDYSTRRLRYLRTRFSAPVYPGETLELQTWHDAGNIRFRCIAVDRQVAVIGNGIAEIDPVKSQFAN